MQRPELWTFHRLKRPDSASEATAANFPTQDIISAWRLETCLREVIVFPRRPNSIPAGWHVRSGDSGYEFLLRLAGGLESAILGETEILGQIKAAWRGFQSSQPLACRALQSTFHALFEDSKELRTLFFRGIGSVSYGSLARRLTGDLALTRPTLVIGAGKLARSILPYFQDRPTLVWNRTPDRIPTGFRALQTESELLDAWATAGNAVVCVPPNPEREGEWLNAWAKGFHSGHTKGHILHFGEDKLRPGMITLPELFAIDRSQNELRQQAAKKAESFCKERTRLRSMGTPLSTAHGWEDLVAFHVT